MLYPINVSSKDKNKNKAEGRMKRVNTKGFILIETEGGKKASL
jgi:hypothetical protein